MSKASRRIEEVRCNRYLFALHEIGLYWGLSAAFVPSHIHGLRPCPFRLLTGRLFVSCISFVFSSAALRSIVDEHLFSAMLFRGLEPSLGAQVTSPGSR